MSPDKLVRMANRIAAFHATQRGPAAQATAQHINDFWDPRMRTALLAHVAAGGEGLRPEAMAAAPLIRRPAA